MLDFKAISDSCPFRVVEDTGAASCKSTPGQFRESFGSSKRYTLSPNVPREQLGDRFIPCRAGSNLLAKFIAVADADKPAKKPEAVQDPALEPLPNGFLTKEEQQMNSYSQLLKTQLLQSDSDSENVCLNQVGCETQGVMGNTNTSLKKNLFRFKQNVRKSDPNCVGTGLLGIDQSKFCSREESAQTPTRNISKVPFKILDAPQLQDDFYLNLVDWSSQNLLSVGLGPSVYVWSACTSKVTRLLDVEEDQDSITSIAWSQRGYHLAVGLNSGITQIWDVQQQKQVRTMDGHLDRVSSCAWNESILSTGSKDRCILHHDIRSSEDYMMKLLGHKQEVCGLKWSFDGKQLASGGNDNKLFLWNLQSGTMPLAKFSDHQAAVKAIAWSPHQYGLLASGGGTADRCIKFWNTLTCECTMSLDTGSQVCNLMFSKNGNELVSTHGYSLNQIIVWKCPRMAKVATLTGHTYRVLYLSMSPDGETIVTGAGDETLRFWNVFPPAKERSANVFGCGGGLVPTSMDVR